MSRDPYRLEAFQIADELLPNLYRATARFPPEERFALQAQVRRAAVSVAANLVEGCARPSKRDYLHFISIAIGSASETRYLIRLAARLEFIERAAAVELIQGFGRVVRALQALSTSLRSEPEARGPRPEAPGR